MYLRSFLLSILIPFWCSILPGQESQIIFERISSEEGLSENVINCIFQDAKGYMWIGTNDGLNRYDGYDFIVYKPNPLNIHSINSNLVYGVTQDLNGIIWVGTTGAGLNRYDPSVDRFSAYPSQQPQYEYLREAQIVSMMTDSRGRVWIGTIKGLYLINNEILVNGEPAIQAIQFDDLDVSRNHSIYKIIEDKSGNIWVGTRNGLYRCYLRDQNTDYKFDRVVVDALASDELAKAVAIDDNGLLVVGTNTGFYHQRVGSDSPVFLKVSDDTRHQTITVDNHGVIWAGTYKGLNRYETNDRREPIKFTANFKHNNDDRYSLSKNVIKATYRDRTGNIWIGTNGGGLNRFNPNRKAFANYGRNLSRDGDQYTSVRSILEDSNGATWLGTEGGGLFYQSPSTDAVPYPPLIPYKSSQSVFALSEITQEDKKYVLVGSEDLPSLQLIDITGNEPTAPLKVTDIEASVFNILQDRHGLIWIATYNRGLYRLTWQGDSYKIDQFVKNDLEQSINSNIVRSLLEDSNGNIWIGTSMGLNMIAAGDTQLDSPKFEVFHNDDEDKNIAYDYILDLEESSTGEIWVGTFGGGICKVALDRSSHEYSFTRYTEADGLVNNTVKSIEADISGNIWVGTNNGLSKYQPEANRFFNYNINDGLQDAEFSEGASFRKSDGQLLFGGINGYNAFYPEQIHTDVTPPQLTFTKLIIKNEVINPNPEDKNSILKSSIGDVEHIELYYDQNDITIEFAAMHYAAPSQNKYQYKLEGYNSDWIADKRYATFTNLRHGNYTLLVKASNGDQTWTEEAKQLGITIHPPFWLTWYAYLCYGLLAIAGLFLLRRYTVISIREKHDLVLEHMEREKLEELNQMKIRFFTNISHELRTPLTLIIAPLENILEKGKNMPPEKLQQQYHYMYKNSKYLLRLVNQLLDFRKLDQGTLNLKVGRGDIIHFLKETTAPFQFLANKKNITFKVVTPRERIETYYDPDVMEKVVYNLLSNAFKFTQSGGEINLNIKEASAVIAESNRKKKKTKQVLQLIVADNGPGFSENKAKKIFNRFYKESSKLENKDGAGIGLSFVKSLVELHRGAISVQSKKGHGATFTVEVPMQRSAYLKSEIDQSQFDLYETSSDPLEYLVTEPPLETLEATPHNSLREIEETLPLLLFVDDNADIRKFIRGGFENDFRIIVAEDGVEGLEMAQSSLPDIIVSDVMMPRMDGIEFCQKLKSDQATSHIPVVLLTAKSTTEDQLDGIKTGADAYVAKPFKLDILRAQLLNIHVQRERLKQRFRQEVILEPQEVTVTSVDEEFLKRAMAIIEDHMSDSEFNVEALVKEMYISRSKLFLKLKALTGQSSSEFIRTVRLKRAIQLLERSDYTIKEVMFMTGFNTGSYFSKCFKKQFGVVPSEYIRLKKEKEGTDQVMTKDQIHKIISPSDNHSLIED